LARQLEKISSSGRGPELRESAVNTLFSRCLNSSRNIKKSSFQVCSHAPGPAARRLVTRSHDEHDGTVRQRRDRAATNPV
jgi:hypothetical protein